MAHILIIDDNDTMREGMAVTLKKAGHEVSTCRNGPDGIATFQKRTFDMVVTDLKMEAMDGIEVVKNLRAHQADVVVMVVSGFGTIETAVAAMREGAFDFIEKPFPPDVLRAKVEKGLELAHTRSAVVKLSAANEALQLDAKNQKGTTLVGQSEPLQKLMALVTKAASTEATVHIHGESGTGKELIARMVHEGSPRNKGPFVVVHCAALAESLLESELFGHEKGSFTGAIKRKLGRFELAEGGTLFLDEIGDISPSTQTKLLRVLQEKEIQRVGGEETVKVNVRVVSATHRDLKKEVAQGRFREDLFYRLHILPLTVPALRERPEDLEALAQHFIKKHAPKINAKVKGLSKDALRALERHAWPGNVRELENVMEQALVFSEGTEIQETDLPAFLQNASANVGEKLPTLRGDRPLPEILEAIEKQYVAQAYKKAEGVKTEAARLLGIKTSALYYKLEKFGLLDAADQAPPT